VHDTDDILKVIGSKFMVTDNIFRKCTLPADAYHVTVCHERLSSSFNRCLAFDVAWRIRD